MWSISGGEGHHNTTTTNSSCSKGLCRGSSSSSSISSSPSPFSPLHNSSARPKTMEEVWKDINLASLHDDNPSRDHHDPHSTNFRGMILQDFLARPFSKDPPPSAAAPVAVSTRYGSPVPPPATMLTLNSSHELHFFGNLDHLRENPLLQHQPMHQVCSQNMPFDAFAPSSGMNPSGKKRVLESNNNSGDRRNKRMIKNRESAARSRARKQAYTNELELEVAHLMEENARLKKQQQQQQLCLPAVAEMPKKHKLHRTSTAPF